MTYAKPTIQGKPAPKIYRFDDMEIVWRADGSMLYKSDRIKHYFIIRDKVTPEQADQEAINIMFNTTHNKQYPQIGTVEVLTIDSKDRYQIVFVWNTKTKSFILSHI